MLSHRPRLRRFAALRFSGGAWAAALAFGLGAPPGAAQAESGGQYLFDEFGTDSGLPQSNVTATLQTREGYLWVGTEGGLARFDGVRFVSFRTTDTPALLSNTINCLYEDREGDLWIGTGAGVVRRHAGKFELLGLRETSVRAIAQDPSGRVWVGTDGQGLHSWQDGQWRGATEGLPNKWIASLYVDAASRLWIGFGKANGVVCAQAGNFRRYGKDGGLDGNVIAICEQPRGTLWFGPHRHGLYRLRDGQLDHFLSQEVRDVTDVKPSADGGFWLASGSLFRVADPDRVSFTAVPRLPTRDIQSFSQDREGSFWLCCGKGGGLVRALQVGYRSISTDDGLPTNAVRTVSEDPQGNIWISQDRGPISRVGADGAVIRNPELGFPESEALTVLAARDGAVWAGFRDQLCVRRGGVCVSFPKIHSVYGIYEDRRGAIWIGTTTEGLFRFDHGAFVSVPLDSGKPIVNATSFCEAPDGSIYIGTWSSGIYRLQGGRISVINRDSGLPSNDVRALYADAENRLWVGLKGRGLAVQADGHWFNPDALSQAVADHVTGIAEDGDGRLWLGTAAGVMSAKEDDLLAAAEGRGPLPQLSIEGMRDGRSTAAVWSGPQPTVWPTRARKLLFATRQGILVIDPAHLPVNNVPPTVRIEEVSLDRRTLDPSPEVTVPAGVREISIAYTALSFIHPERVLFKYKLEGYDRDWIEAGTRRAAFYTNLPVGRYVFRVQACNSDGVWNERGARLGIVQQPGFFQTRWFYAAIVLAVAAGGWGLNRWSNRRLKLKLERLEQKQAMERERGRIARNLHDELGANLTELSLFAERLGRKTNSPETVQEMRFLSERVRGLADALDTVVWTVNPANDSLSHLTLYLSGLFQDLFRLSSIRARLDVARAIPAYHLTPEERSHIFLAAKEAMNNVIKHSGASEAWLRIKMVGTRFCLAIEDNGRGFDPASVAGSVRNGLGNMRSRIGEVGGTFALDSVAGQSTSVRIFLDFAERSLAAGNGHGAAADRNGAAPEAHP